MNDAKTNPWAEVKRLEAENGQLRVRLAAEEILTKNVRAQLAATEQALQEVQRESAELREDRDFNRQRVIELQRESLELKQREVGRVSTLRECDQLLIAYGELVILFPPKPSRALAEPPPPPPTLLVNQREKDPLVGFFPGFPPSSDVKRAEKGLAQDGGSQETAQFEPRIGQD